MLLRQVLRSHKINLRVYKESFKKKKKKKKASERLVGSWNYVSKLYMEMSHIISMPFRERSEKNIGFFKKSFVFFLNSIYKTYNKTSDSNQRQEGKTSPKSAPLQSDLLAYLYFNYDQSLVGQTGVQLLDFCCSSVSELVCCWVLVLFHLSDESWFICSLFWFIDE